MHISGLFLRLAALYTTSTALVPKLVHNTALSPFDSTLASLTKKDNGWNGACGICQIGAECDEGGEKGARYREFFYTPVEDAIKCLDFLEDYPEVRKIGWNEIHRICAQGDAEVTVEALENRSEMVAVNSGARCALNQIIDRCTHPDGVLSHAVPGFVSGCAPACDDSNMKVCIKTNDPMPDELKPNKLM